MNTVIDILGELFAFLESEPKTLHENILIQQMDDKRFVLTDAEIKRMRGKYIEDVKREYNTPINFKEDLRQKYVNRLYLLNTSSKEHYYTLGEISC